MRKQRNDEKLVAKATIMAEKTLESAKMRMLKNDFRSGPEVDGKASSGQGGLLRVFRLRWHSP